MSGDRYYGDVVHMHGGQGNTGIVNHRAAHAAQAPSPELQAAVQGLVELLRELRGQVSSANAQTIDDSLPEISTDGSAEPQERHKALLAVAGIAATVGAVGQPVLDAVNKVLELLGAK